jgi:CheY-like chemotaxis protein
MLWRFRQESARFRGFMTAKCALIVDDSRTARQVLGDVLCANQLRVETAASAEEALEYLSRSRPDVIFMDHMMPGMDGFQAVRAIKTNPATATIPIMMYTSQEGELYVGQARALGAVGVLPKQIRPVEVSEVLRSLHLIENPEARASVHPTPEVSPASGDEKVEPERDVTAALNARDWTDLHRWLQEMFEDYRREMRTDLEAAVSRVLREHGTTESVATTAAPPRPRRSVSGTLLVLALAALAGVFYWLSVDTQSKWRSAVEQNAGLMATLASRRAVASVATTDTVRQLDAERDEISNQFLSFVAGLEWGVNQSAAYPPGEEPFGNRRLETLRGLLERLNGLGFTGLVRLDSHLGDFCYVAGPDDSWTLAPDDLPADRCGRIGLPSSEARAASARESVSFANFLSARPQDAAVRVELMPHGNTSPAVPYPPDPQGLTAGEWNLIARQNNRVSVTLLADNAQP